MGDIVRMFCPAFLALTSVSHTRALILCFDFQCLTIFSLMFLVDPDPHIRIYFMFYITVFTLPTSYVVVFGNRIWMRIAFVCQLTRMVFIAFHNIFYPIFVAAFVAIGYDAAHPNAKSEEILMNATSYGGLIFFMSLTASLWEPAKLYHIWRLQKMLETSEYDGDFEIEREDSYQTSICESENSTFTDTAVDVPTNIV